MRKAALAWNRRTLSAVVTGAVFLGVLLFWYLGFPAGIDKNANTGQKLPTILEPVVGVPTRTPSQPDRGANGRLNALADGKNEKSASATDTAEDCGSLKGLVRLPDLEKPGEIWVGLFVATHLYERGLQAFVDLAPDTQPFGRSGSPLDMAGFVLVSESATDDAGRFEVRCPCIDGNVSVVVRDEERGFFAIEGPVACAGRTIEIDVHALCTCDFVILDKTTGSPVAGCDVRVTNRRSEQWSKTLDDGVIRIEQVPCSEYSIAVSHGAYKTYTGEVKCGEEGVQTLQLTPITESGRVISGVIVDRQTNTPIVGAKVHAYAANEERFSQSNDQGGYEIRIQATGETERISLGAEATGYVAEMETFSIESKGLEWNPRLTRSVEVLVRVSSKSAPVAGTRVCAAEADQRLRKVCGCAVTNHEGFATLSNLNPDFDVVLFASHPQAGVARERIPQAVVAAANTDGEWIELELTRGTGQVHVVVENDDNSPVPNAVVLFNPESELHTEQEDMREEDRVAVVSDGAAFGLLGGARKSFGEVLFSRCNDRGEVSLENLSCKFLLVQAVEPRMPVEDIRAVDGGVTLKELANGNFARSAVEVVEVSDKWPASITLNLSRPRRVSGKVAEHDGEAAANTLVFLYEVDDAGAWKLAKVAVTNRHGQYYFDPIDSLKEYGVGVSLLVNEQLQIMLRGPARDEVQFPNFGMSRDRVPDPTSLEAFLPFESRASEDSRVDLQLPPRAAKK